MHSRPDPGHAVKDAPDAENTGAPESVSVDEFRPEHLDAVLDMWREVGKRTVITVRGASMVPFLRPGHDLVLDHSAAVHPLGAVIVFLQGRMLVAHRVVGRDRRGGYLTKGDAILHFDRGPVAARRVVGRVVALREGEAEVPLATARGISAVLVAVLSRAVGELNRVCRLLRWLSSPAGRLAGVVPGPTRLLKVLNRGVMRLAARTVGGATGPDDAAGSSG